MIPNKVIYLQLFLDRFGLEKSQGNQELTNPVTPISHNYKRGVCKEMFYQHNVNVTLLVAEWRRVAQWAHNPEVRGSKPRSSIDSFIN